MLKLYVIYNFIHIKYSYNTFLNITNINYYNKNYNYIRTDNQLIQNN